MREEPELPQGDIAPGCPHPRSVYDLLGHDDAEQKIAAALGSGHMHHAWLLTGPAGVGKATLAYRLIRRILGGAPQTLAALDVPQSDPIAARVESLGHGDFLLLRRPYDFKTKKLRTEITVSETRKLQDFFSRKPAEGGWRVALIDSADQMNISAANGVLKTLEEPPDKALLILLSSEPGRLLPTIRSRCMHLALRGVSTGEITEWLTAQNNPPALAKLAASLSRGAPGKAFALAENESAVLRPLQNWLASLPHGNAQLEHRIADSLAAPKAIAARALFWDALTDLVYHQARYAAAGQWPEALNNAGMKPLRLDRPQKFWLSLWEELQGHRRAEMGLNMDKKTVMLTALSAVRAQNIKR